MAEAGAPPRRRRNLTTATILIAVVAGMGGLSLASVPLYRIFCAATGYEGTVQRASRAPTHVADALVTVRFDTTVAADLPWQFRPLQPQVTLRPGERKQVFFRAVNHSDEAITARAVYNVTPLKVGLYFDKLQCFCFSNQRLLPGQSVDMGVVFFVDPTMLTDRSTREVRTITLSYTMFRTPVAEATAPARPTPVSD